MCNPSGVVGNPGPSIATDMGPLTGSGEIGIAPFYRYLSPTGMCDGRQSPSNPARGYILLITQNTTTQYQGRLFLQLFVKMH